MLNAEIVNHEGMERVGKMAFVSGIFGEVLYGVGPQVWMLMLVWYLCLVLVSVLAVAAGIVCVCVCC